MAFEREVFPEVKLKHGVGKSVVFPVSTITNGNVEYRNSRISRERFKFTIQTKNLLQADKEAIRGFFTNRSHALNSFLFQDPDIPSLDDAILSYHSGSGNSKWIVALPIDSSTPGNHWIYNIGSNGSGSPLTGSPLPTATVNASPETISAFTIESDGTPTITVANSDNGDTVRLTAEIYFVVRLDSTLNYVLGALNINNRTAGVAMNQIVLQEVYEY